MDSAPAGATRMGSRSSTRHGGPAQVFVGPVRKWRKVWSPVSSSSPSPSAVRVVLYKWTPITASNGGLKEESATPEETTSPLARPVKYLPVSVVIERKKQEIATEEDLDDAEAGADAENDDAENDDAENDDAENDDAENEDAENEDAGNEEVNEATTDMEAHDSEENQDKIHDQRHEPLAMEHDFS